MKIEINDLCVHFSLFTHLKIKFIKANNQQVLFDNVTLNFVHFVYENLIS